MDKAQYSVWKSNKLSGSYYKGYLHSLTDPICSAFNLQAINLFFLCSCICSQCKAVPWWGLASCIQHLSGFIWRLQFTSKDWIYRFHLDSFFCLSCRMWKHSLQPAFIVWSKQGVLGYALELIICHIWLKKRRLSSSQKRQFGIPKPRKILQGSGHCYSFCL